MLNIKSKRPSSIDRFIALPDAEKNRMVREIESETREQRLARSRPLNARERQLWRRFKKKMGRPRVGQGAKVISLSVERQLLKRADAYAKKHGMSRAMLVAHGLQAILGPAA